MIHIFLGTKAQLIKMAPVMVELQDRGIPYNFIFSGQHQATVDGIRDDFGLKRPDTILYDGRDITGILQMMFWSARIIFYTLRNHGKVWQNDKGGLVLNHGDTFSTLLGSILARLSGQQSVHVESGLRSYNYIHPFPEEIIRLLTFRFSDIYFAPGEWALSNLVKYKGLKVNTVNNTLLDSLRICRNHIALAEVSIPRHSFAVVSIHRFENVFFQKRLVKIVELLTDTSRIIPLIFILHKPTLEKLSQYGLLKDLVTNPRIELRPRYGYFQFIKLLKMADVAITDGGSNQEECYYLGKPCVILRNASERQEGLSDNAILCKYDFDLIRKVVSDPKCYQRKSQEGSMSPSRVIVDFLISQQH